MLRIRTIIEQPSVICANLPEVYRVREISDWTFDPLENQPSILLLTWMMFFFVSGKKKKEKRSLQKVEKIPRLNGRKKPLKSIKQTAFS